MSGRSGVLLPYAKHSSETLSPRSGDAGITAGNSFGMFGSFTVSTRLIR